MTDPAEGLFELEGHIEPPFEAQAQEWVVFSKHPHRGHKVDDDRPTHTRCGLRLVDGMPVSHPRYAHTDCLLRADVASQPELDGDEIEVAS